MSRRSRSILGAVARWAMAAGIATTVMATGPVAAQQVAREDTLVLTPWGFFQEFPTNNFNVIAAGGFPIQQQIGNKTVYEPLFVMNLNNGELIPWLGESFRVSDDFMTVDLKLRDRVTWSDGRPFTADDVKFTLDLLRQGRPNLLYSNVHAEWVRQVDVVDRLNVRIHLTKPGPRYFRDNLALGHENHTVILPRHIWDGKDPATFANLDLQAGHPIGTGAYKLVRIASNQYVFDRRDDWWGVAAGFDDLPQPRRIVMTTVNSDDAMGALFLGNQVDTGNPLQPGTFEAVKAVNQRVRSWNTKGPVWGSADGCGFVLQFNLLRPTWQNRDLRLAINYAIDRKQAGILAYEGSMPPWEAPYSAYIHDAFVPGQIQSVIDRFARNRLSPERVASHMAAAGYARNAEGRWAKDGRVLTIPIAAPSFRRQLVPVLAQQLRNAGFEVTQRIDDQYAAAFDIGEHDTVVIVHCGSITEPYDSMRYLHSKWSRPVGERIPFRLAGSRYQNPAYDAVIDRMEAIVADRRQGSEYMNLAARATEIFLEDMPQIPIVEEFHVVAFNTTHWTNWPTAETPYVAPYFTWGAFIKVIHDLKKAR